MPELMFVLKAFLVSVIITVCLQIKVGNSSIESQASLWLQTSSLPVYLTKVSQGAVLAIRNAGGAAKDFVGKTFNRDSGSARAGRLNLQFKRSPTAEAEPLAEKTKENN
jgi:hypothetical protein